MWRLALILLLTVAGAFWLGCVCPVLAGGVVMNDREREWRAYAQLCAVVLSVALLVACGLLWANR